MSTQDRHRTEERPRKTPISYSICLRDKIKQGQTIELCSDYGKDSILLAALAYNCGPGVVNKSTVLKKLKSGDRNIFRAYTSHCHYRGKWHRGLYNRRCTELITLYQP